MMSGMMMKLRKKNYDPLTVCLLLTMDLRAISATVQVQHNSMAVHAELLHVVYILRSDS